jgi:hypothetical protein
MLAIFARPCYIFFILGVGWDLVSWYLGCKWAHCTNPRWYMRNGHLVWWELAGETEFHFVHHRTRMNWSGMEFRLLQCEAGNQLTELWHIPAIILSIQPVMLFLMLKYYLRVSQWNECSCMTHMKKRRFWHKFQDVTFPNRKNYSYSHK